MGVLFFTKKHKQRCLEALENYTKVANANLEVDDFVIDETLAVLQEHSRKKDFVQLEKLVRANNPSRAIKLINAM